MNITKNQSKECLNYLNDLMNEQNIPFKYI